MLRYIGMVDPQILEAEIFTVELRKSNFNSNSISTRSIINDYYSYCYHQLPSPQSQCLLQLPNTSTFPTSLAARCSAFLSTRSKPRVKSASPQLLNPPNTHQHHARRRPHPASPASRSPSDEQPRNRDEESNKLRTYWYNENESSSHGNIGTIESDDTKRTPRDESVDTLTS
jgi:hypothetical protein